MDIIFYVIFEICSFIFISKNFSIIDNISFSQVAEDIASALKYLHEEKKLLHGDLKSANILIKGDFEIAKLCDFGVTLHLDEQVRHSAL